MKVNAETRSNILSAAKGLSSVQKKHLTPKEQKVLDLVAKEKHLNIAQFIVAKQLKNKLVTVKKDYPGKVPSESTWEKTKQLGTLLEPKKIIGKHREMSTKIARAQQTAKTPVPWESPIKETPVVHKLMEERKFDKLENFLRDNLVGPEKALNFTLPESNFLMKS
jgi:hypothetical protein